LSKYKKNPSKSACPVLGKVDAIQSVKTHHIEKLSTGSNM